MKFRQATRPLIAATTVGLSYLFPGFVWAQATGQIVASTSGGGDGDITTLIVTLIAAPLVGALIKHWVDGRDRSYADQWTAVSDSNKQLKEDRDKLYADLARKDAEIDRLEGELRESYKTIAQLESKVGIYKYRLSRYEPTTGEVDRVPSTGDGKPTA